MIIGWICLITVLFFNHCTAAAINRKSSALHGCSVAKPCAITNVDSNTFSAPGHQTKDAMPGHNFGNEIEISFSIPKNSIGCKLELNVPTELQAASSSNQQIDFWSVQNNVGTQQDWNGTSDIRKRLGTVTIQPNVTSIPIGSCHCREVTRVSACIADSLSSSDMTIPHSALEGVVLKYNC